ncbi:MAG TPA: nucleotide pyrophosphatase/phosphodiesterase family protein [Tepidisphaeraceae bacterium]|jgi:predicted AlkP superfamily pyrophosphatase or phosphodiesterase|nr:nucleotide pyrophosphatase/phosphodiesterase family protein [Tepidisphaeraceae bacterium]
MKYLSTLIISLLFLTQGCASSSTHPHPTNSTTLLWISIDGLKGAYIQDPIARTQRVRGSSDDQDPTPFLSSLLSHSYYSRQLIPIFPSLTFPSHSAEATGVPASQHGITSNTFYDPATHQKYSFPDDPRLLQSEPIWLTAPRQHVRTAVIDWPLSNHPSLLPAGTPLPDYSSETYNNDLTDTQRLGHLADLYAADFTTHPNGPPLRLLMGYIHAVDTAGHRFGPDSPEITQTLRATDEVLHTAILRIAATFDAHSHPGDSLYILLTADHGMSTVTSNTNLQSLLGDSLPASATSVTSGPLANIYLDQLPPNERASAIHEILSRLAPAQRAGLSYWTPSTLPKDFSYNNPRSGDLILMLPNHQTFHTPSHTPSLPPKGMHGYTPTLTPDMQAFTLLCPLRSPHPLTRPINLGPLDSLRLEPTAAHLLDITPNPQAIKNPIPTIPNN